jgi:hypothetical protein
LAWRFSNDCGDLTGPLLQLLTGIKVRAHAGHGRFACVVVLQHLKLARARYDSTVDLNPHQRDCTHGTPRKRKAASALLRLAAKAFHPRAGMESWRQVAEGVIPRLSQSRHEMTPTTQLRTENTG